MKREFWSGIRRGLSIDEAAAAVGVSEYPARKWFAEGGGMPPMSLTPLSGRYLSFAEREEIAILYAQGVGVREIARRVGRDPGTISRELRRNCQRRNGRCSYRASYAQIRADERSLRPKPSKLVTNQRLREYVAAKLVGREHWSPEQISNRLRVDFPDDEGMRVHHETIYQAIYVQGRGALRRELAACLRTGRAVRKPQRRPDERRGRMPGMVSISERPAEVEDRAVPGHWEGDLIVGKNSASAIGTLVERSTRFTMLLHLSDHTAPTVRDAITSTITTLPAALRRSLTWDQGSEMTEHVQLSFDTDLEVYFCDPRSPWQRGTNENTNGLLRQYFPKSTDLSVHPRSELEEVAAALNGRPRKTLGWRTPAEALTELLSAP